MSETLEGQLLIAAPSLFDYFRRTVVLVIEHTPKERWAWCSTARSIRASPAPFRSSPSWPMGTTWSDPAGRSHRSRWWLSASSATYRKRGWPWSDSSARSTRVGQRVARPDACMPGTPAGAPVSSTTRAEQDAWLVAPAHGEDPFEDDVWSRALERRGGEYRLLATMPARPVAELGDLEAGRQRTRGLARGLQRGATRPRLVGHGVGARAVPSAFTCTRSTSQSMRLDHRVPVDHAEVRPGRVLLG